MTKKRLPMVIITIAVAVVMLTVSVSAYYFFVGGAAVSVDLDVHSRSAVAKLSTSANLNSYTITVTGTYLRTDGTVGTATKTVWGPQSISDGISDSCRLSLPSDGVQWTNSVVATFSAYYNNDTSGTSITKLV